MAGKKRPEPKIIRPDDIDPHHRWDRPLQSPGHSQVDFEERVDFRRLHDYRLARTRAALANSGLGALLCFDQHNIRYMHEHRHRRMGARQADAIFTAHRQRRPVHLGFRLRGEAPPAACAVAAPRPLPRGAPRPARRRRRGHRALQLRRARDQGDRWSTKASPTCRSASMSSSRRCSSSCRSSGSTCATASRRCCRRAK